MATKKKLFIGLIIVIAAMAIIRVFAPIGLIGIMLWGSINAKPEVLKTIQNTCPFLMMTTQTQYGQASGEWMKVYGRAR